MNSYTNVDAMTATEWESTMVITGGLGDNFSPILSEGDGSHYRVLIERDRDDIYMVYTGDNMVRILQEAMLPKEILSKLAMIKAYENNSGNVRTSLNLVWSPIDMYLNTFPSEFNDIGWRCTSLTREFYCVIVTVETLNSLRGESL